MKKTGHAFFVHRPATINDLQRPHPLEREQAYTIVKTIALGVIDYENFITDMLVDRQFIEDYADRCERGESWKCLYVHQRGCKDGVLVMPDKDCYVKYAAYLSEAKE